MTLTLGQQLDKKIEFEADIAERVRRFEDDMDLLLDSIKIAHDPTWGAPPSVRASAVVDLDAMILRKKWQMESWRDA